MERQAVDVVSIQKQRAVRHIVGAEQEVDQRCFAAAGIADNADALTGGNLKRNIVQHIKFTVRIPESEMAELDFTARNGNFDSVRMVGNLRLGVEQLADAFKRGLAARNHLNHL